MTIIVMLLSVIWGYAGEGESEGSRDQRCSSTNTQQLNKHINTK